MSARPTTKITTDCGFNPLKEDGNIQTLRPPNSSIAEQTGAAHRGAVSVSVWGFRVCRGKDTPSAAQLAICLIDSLPQRLIDGFRLRCLADTAFGSVLFLTAMKQRRIPLIVGDNREHNLVDGRKVYQLVKKGQFVSYYLLIVVNKKTCYGLATWLNNR